MINKLDILNFLFIDSLKYEKIKKENKTSIIEINSL